VNPLLKNPKATSILRRLCKSASKKEGSYSTYYMIRLYTKSETARLAGVTFGVLDYHTRKGYVQGSSYVSGKNNCLYTAQEVAALKEHFSKTVAEFKKEEMAKRHLYTTAQAARELKIAPDTLYGMVRRGRIAKPTHVVSALSRYTRYNEEDLKQLKIELKDYHSKKSATRRREEFTKNGYLSPSEAAKALHVPHVTLVSWIKNGSIERPQTKVEGERHSFYTKPDLKIIRNKKAKYFAKQGKAQQ